MILITLALAQDNPPPVEIDWSREGEVSGEILAILGPRQLPSSNNGRVDLGASVSADFSSQIDCGAIRFEGDFNAVLPDVSDIPQQLATNGQNLLAALPMLTICHTSPSLCAELKNLNFRIDEEWNFTADVCRAMDNYIDDQAERGEREARNRWKRDCVRRREQQGVDHAVAVRACEEDQPGDDGYLVVDIAQGYLTRAVTDAPQQVVRSALTATQSELSRNEEFYEFLVAVGGETELQHNGVSIPLFPPSGNLLAEELAEDMRSRSVRTACSMPLNDIFGEVDEFGYLQPGTAPQSGATGADAATRFWTKEMYGVFTTEFSKRDAENLHTLDTKVFWSMCEHLADVVTAETVTRLEATIASELALMKENPALGEVGRRKLKDIEEAIKALQKQIDGKDLPSIPQYRFRLEEMADVVRQQRRDIAGSLTAGDAREDVLGDAWLNCSSYSTCGGQ